MAMTIFSSAITASGAFFTSLIMAKSSLNQRDKDADLISFINEYIKRYLSVDKFADHLENIAKDDTNTNSLDIHVVEDKEATKKAEELINKNIKNYITKIYKILKLFLFSFTTLLPQTMIAFSFLTSKAITIAWISTPLAFLIKTIINILIFFLTLLVLYTQARKFIIKNEDQTSSIKNLFLVIIYQFSNHYTAKQKKILANFKNEFAGGKTLMQGMENKDQTLFPTKEDIEEKKESYYKNPHTVYKIYKTLGMVSQIVYAISIAIIFSTGNYLLAIPASIGFGIGIIANNNDLLKNFFNHALVENVLGVAAVVFGEFYTKFWGFWALILSTPSHFINTFSKKLNDLQVFKTKKQTFNN